MKKIILFSLLSFCLGIVFCYFSMNLIQPKKDVIQTTNNSNLQDTTLTIKTQNEAVSDKKPEKEKDKSVIKHEMNGDFRYAKWGATREEIIEMEGKKPEIEQDKYVAFGEDTLLGLECLYAYYFNDSKFYQGVYMFINNHTNKTDYIDDFKSIKSELTKKYGTPLDDNTIWKDDLYKDDPTDWGMAIVTGDLLYITRWRIGETMIALSLDGDNYKISFNLTYANEKIAMNKGKDTSGL